MGIGYDKWKLNQGLLLHLTFEEMTGILTHDRAKPAYPHTLHGVPVWTQLANGLPYLEFNKANPDYLDCPQASTVDLNFTTQDFSGAMWIYLDSVAVVDAAILFHRSTIASGWNFNTTGGGLGFWTVQAGASQITLTSNWIMSAGRWYLMGFTRIASEPRCHLYLNGVDVHIPFPLLPHINPATANVALTLGSTLGGANLQMDGKIAGGPCGPRIWGKGLKPWEWKLMFETERHWFGV